MERWTSAMLLMASAAWVALHVRDMWTLVTGMWMAFGVVGVVVCLRAQLKLRYGAAPASRRRRGTGRHT